MSIDDKNTLKSYFKTAGKPTEGQYSNLIDSSLNMIDDKAEPEAININDNDHYITPKGVKTIIDKYGVKTVNKISPDQDGNIEVADISGSALTIRGEISLAQVETLETELNNKVGNDNIKTINGETIIGKGNIDTGAAITLMALPSSPYTIPGTTSPIAFPANCDTFHLSANRTYIFRGKYLITNGTSHTLSMGWQVTDMEVISIEYVAALFSSNLNAFATASSRTQVSGIALKVLNSSTASPTTTIEFEGILRSGRAGTIAPLIAFSTPAATPLSTMKPGSFIEFIEIGNSTIQTIGAVD